MSALPRVLVSGAGGFVGTALTAHLLERGHRVGAAVRAPCAALPPAARQHALGDFSPATDWRAALAGVDVVVHLAARAHVLRDAASSPLAAFRAMNVDVTLNLARQAARGGVRRFVFLSSIGVHGAETFGAPFSEQSEPAPHSDYARSKIEAERGLEAICAEHGMQFVIIRPPLIYGANAPGNFARLLGIVRRGGVLPLGAVQNRRSMLSLENLVDFIQLCAVSDGAADQVFLVADGADIATPALIALLSEGMGRRARLFPVPLPLLRLGAAMLGRQNLFRQLCGSLQVDVGKARALLGWRPPATVRAALLRTAQEYAVRKEAAAPRRRPG